MNRLLLALLAILVLGHTATAHQLNSVSVAADFRTDGSYSIKLSVEPARIPVDKTAPFPPIPPEAEEPLDEAEREAIFNLAEPFFQSTFTYFFDGEAIAPPQLEFSFETIAEKDAVAEGVAFRDGENHLFVVAEFGGQIPAGAENFHIRLGTELSLAVVFVGSVDGEQKGRVQALFAGEESKGYPLAWAKPTAGSEGVKSGPQDIPRDAFVIRAARYTAVGFEHILPEGLDHIFFVLGLFFLSQRLGPLLWQVTAFTVAHTITLALAYLDIVRVSSDVVEPLIALSIAVVALENVFTKRLRPHRVVIVFAFGLLHGLGFAGAFADLHLPKEEFIEGLIFLNIGVEIGQLAVIASALVITFLFLSAAGKNREVAGRRYRSFFAIPASIYIAAVGIVATVDRVWPDSIPRAFSFLQIL